MILKRATSPLDPFGQVHHFLQQAVQAMTNDDNVLARLDVDIARAALERALDDQVDQVDDRRRLRRSAFAATNLFEDLVFRPRNEAGTAAVDQRREHAAGRRVLGALTPATLAVLHRKAAATGLIETRKRLVGIGCVNRFDDFGARRDDLLDAVAGLELEVLNQREEQRIRHRHRQQVLFNRDGDAGALEGDILGNQDDRRRVGRVLREIDV